jgi:hypothetical protein
LTIVVVRCPSLVDRDKYDEVWFPGEKESP